MIEFTKEEVKELDELDKKLETCPENERAMHLYHIADIIRQARQRQC